MQKRHPFWHTQYPNSIQIPYLLFTLLKWTNGGNIGPIFDTDTDNKIHNGGQAFTKVWRGFEYLISPENN